MSTKKIGDENEEGDNGNSDEQFGLPNVEYEPLKRSEEPETIVQGIGIGNKPQPPNKPPIRKNEPSGGSPLPIIVVILLLIIGGGSAYYFYYRPKAQKAEADRIALENKRKADAEKQRLADEARRLQEEEQRRADSLANAQPKVGTVEVLNERLGRYHVIISSDVDDDLLMDYAKKLGTKGLNTKIIPPFRNVKFYRLSIADKETYSEAQSTADQMKADYGENLWVLKY